MILTGKQIAAEKIVGNYDQENAIQQVGIDVRAARIFSLEGTGNVPAQGKTKLPSPKAYPQTVTSWVLEPGYYEVELMESINLPANRTLTFKTRSSCVRNGVIVHSGQFDPGFKTDRAGCFIEVLRKTIIEQGARIAQAIVEETHEVTNTYEGQFQGDKQRN